MATHHQRPASARGLRDISNAANQVEQQQQLLSSKHNNHHGLTGAAGLGWNIQ